MQNLALITGVVGVISLGLLDRHIDKNIFRAGKWIFGISLVIFLISEGLVLAGR